MKYIRHTLFQKDANTVEEDEQRSCKDGERTSVEGCSDTYLQSLLLWTKLHNIYFQVVLTTRNDEDLNLEEVEVEGKGRGVKARVRFVKGEPVVEYKGQVVSVEEGRKREAKISPNFANIFYSHTFSKSKCAQSFCVDASKEVPGRFGRLVNHSHKSPNCQIEVVDSFKGSPHLVLVAARDIGIGEELLIDYGVTDREVLEANPWLRQS